MSPLPQNRACDFHRTRLKQTGLKLVLPLPRQVSSRL